MGCATCVKPSIECKSCNLVAAKNLLQDVLERSPKDLHVNPEDLQEIEFELFSMFDRERNKIRGDNMEPSGLLKIIARCSDTTVYLTKGKEDWGVILFDIEELQAFITNGDVIIRIANLSEDMLDGLPRELPAYDYYSEKFIPNPLPQTPAQLSKFFAGEFIYSISLPVTTLIDGIYKAYSQPVRRRNALAVFDIGRAFQPDDLVIPKFELDGDTPICTIPGIKPVTLVKGSKIGRSLLQENTSYLGKIVREDSDIFHANVYRRFESVVSFAMYEKMGRYLDSQLDIYDIMSYPEGNVIRFPLFSKTANNNIDDISSFKGYWPIVVDLEYLFETLLMFSSFSFINIYFNGPNDGFLIEGHREDLDAPIIEALISPIAIGDINVQSAVRW